MSTNDMVDAMSNAFKRTTVYYNGHSFTPMAKIHQGTGVVYDSINPNNGPILFINDQHLRYNADVTIDFTYSIADESGYVDLEYNGFEYRKMYYKSGTGVGTGQVVIPANTKQYSQTFFGDSLHIDQLHSISSNDTTIDITVYCIGDIGSRLLYGANTETERALVEDVLNSIYISPPVCRLCDGEGEYEGDVCPDCSGYQYDGRNARSYMLLQRAKDIGIVKRSETELNLQYRAWSAKTWTIPTKYNVRKHLAFFLNTDIANITIEEHYLPETYWKVIFPIATFGAISVGTRMSLDDNSILEMMQDLAPAGTNPVYEGYYLFIDDTNISGYDAFADDWDGWNMQRFGSQFNTHFFFENNNYVSGGGIGTGTFSGLFVGLTEDDYKDILLYDNFW